MFGITGMHSNGSFRALKNTTFGITGKDMIPASINVVNDNSHSIQYIGTEIDKKIHSLKMDIVVFQNYKKSEPNEAHDYVMKWRPKLKRVYDNDILTHSALDFIYNKNEYYSIVYEINKDTEKKLNFPALLMGELHDIVPSDRFGTYIGKTKFFWFNHFVHEFTIGKLNLHVEREVFVRNIETNKVKKIFVKHYIPIPPGLRLNTKNLIR